MEMREDIRTSPGITREKSEEYEDERKYDLVWDFHEPYIIEYESYGYKGCSKEESESCDFYSGTREYE